MCQFFRDIAKPCKEIYKYKLTTGTSENKNGNVLQPDPDPQLLFQVWYYLWYRLGGKSSSLDSRRLERADRPALRWGLNRNKSLRAVRLNLGPVQCHSLQFTWRSSNNLVNLGIYINPFFLLNFSILTRLNDLEMLYLYFPNKLELKPLKRKDLALPKRKDSFATMLYFGTVSDFEDLLLHSWIKFTKVTIIIEIFLVWKIIIGNHGTKKNIKILVR